MEPKLCREPRQCRMPDCFAVLISACCHRLHVVECQDPGDKPQAHEAGDKTPQERLLPHVRGPLGPAPATVLEPAAEADQYLAMRRAFGFKLISFGQMLHSFVAYLEASGVNVITAEAALAWATTTPRSVDEVRWSRRLMVVRVFARHLAVFDPATEIPRADVLPNHCRRITPHLYTDSEVTALLNAASSLTPAPAGPDLPDPHLAAGSAGDAHW